MRILSAKPIRHIEKQIFEQCLRESQGDSILLTYKGFPRWDNDEFPNRDFLSVFNDHIVYDNDYRGIRRALESIGKDDSVDKLVEYIDAKHFPKAAKAVDNISMKFNPSEDTLTVTVTLNTKATPKIVEEVKDYITTQIADGWGEGLEQTPVYETTIYAAYDDEYIELYATEREAEKACLNNNSEIDFEGDDDDYKYEGDVWAVASVNIGLYYSFWKPDQKMPMNVEIVRRASL